MIEFRPQIAKTRRVINDFLSQHHTAADPVCCLKRRQMAETHIT